MVTSAKMATRLTRRASSWARKQIAHTTVVRFTSTRPKMSSSARDGFVYGSRFGMKTSSAIEAQTAPLMAIQNQERGDSRRGID